MSEQPTKKEYQRQRANQIIVRFSDEELAELNEAIAESGLSKTDFFLQLMRKKNIIIVSDLKEICVELKRQGINLNQGLRYYHEAGFTEKIKTAIYNCNELYKSAMNLFLSTENKIQKGRKRKVAGQQKKENESVISSSANTSENVTAKIDDEVPISESESMAIAKRIEKYQAEKETKE